MTPPSLFDTHLLPARWRRAHGLGFAGGADFLHRAAAASLSERLDDITRSFEDALVLGPVASLAKNPAAKAIKARTGTRVVNTAAPLPDTLQLAEESHDLAISLMLLHWANDPVGHLIQLRRALRPDGLALVALLGGQTLTELRMALAEAETEMAGGLSPRVAPMGEIRDLGGLVQRAGLAMPVADSDRLQVTYPSALDLMRDLRAMSETNILSARAKGMMRRDMLARTAEIYAHHFPAEGGRVRATFEIVYLTGWAPGPDQPKPLRPGSAKARLADALGTMEHPAGDKTGR
ncbi:MAG: methyltransferase domain-containing protein [Pseudomonadota bacterium]